MYGVMSGGLAVCGLHELGMEVILERRKMKWSVRGVN